MRKQESNVIPLPLAPWRQSLEIFRSTLDVADYLEALRQSRLASGPTQAADECRSVYLEVKSGVIAKDARSVISGICAFGVRKPLAKSETLSKRSEHSPELSAAIGKVVSAFVNEAQANQELSERHSNRYAGFWPAMRSASIYGMLEENDPGLIVASYLKALRDPSLAHPSEGTQRCIADAPLAEHLFMVFLTSCDSWSESEPLSSAFLLLVPYMLGIFPTLEEGRMASRQENGEMPTQQAYSEFLAKVRAIVSELPQPLVTGLICRLCADSDHLLEENDSEDVKLFVSLLNLPIDYSSRVALFTSHRSKRTENTSPSQLSIEIVPRALDALGFAIFDFRLSDSEDEQSLAALWKRLARYLQYGPREHGALLLTNEELAEATSGIIQAADRHHLEEESLDSLTDWIPLFPMLLNGYGGAWAFFGQGRDVWWREDEILKVYLAMHDVAIRDGFRDLGAAILGVVAVEFSLFEDQPMILASRTFVDRIVVALEGPGSKSLHACLRLAREVFSQRELWFAQRWISQFIIDIHDKPTPGESELIKTVPLSTARASSRTEVDRDLQRLLPTTIRDVLGENAWEYLVDAELQWSILHRYFATPEQSDWGGLVVAYFKAIEQPIVNRYAPIFELAPVRDFCIEVGIDIGRSVSIGLVRMFLSRGSQHPDEVTSLLKGHGLALQGDKELVKKLSELIRLRNSAAHGTEKVTAENFARFRALYFSALPDIAARLA